MSQQPNISQRSVPKYKSNPMSISDMITVDPDQRHWNVLFSVAYCLLLVGTLYLFLWLIGFADRNPTVTGIIVGIWFAWSLRDFIEREDE